jgi:hypothetical protein
MHHEDFELPGQMSAQLLLERGGAVASIPCLEKGGGSRAQLPDAALDILPEALRGEPAQEVVSLLLDAQAHQAPSSRSRKRWNEFIPSISSAAS